MIVRQASLRLIVIQQITVGVDLLIRRQAMRSLGSIGYKPPVKYSWSSRVVRVTRQSRADSSHLRMRFTLHFSLASARALASDFAIVLLIVRKAIAQLRMRRMRGEFACECMQNHSRVPIHQSAKF